MPQKIKKENIHMAGEYITAGEICRRNYFAQITLGRWKRTDILVYNPEKDKELRIEVKAKMGREWPGIKGIPLGEKNLLIFVDFKDRSDTERPNLFILDPNDWQDYLKKHVMNKETFDNLKDGYCPIWKDGYVGAGVRPEQILQHKEDWNKLTNLLN